MFFVNTALPASASTLDEYVALAATTQAGYVLVADDGTVIIPEDSPSEYVSNPRLRLIDFWQWSNCFTFNNEKFTIKSYQTSGTNFYSGTVALQCGADSTHGYRHIAFEHQAHWESKRNSSGLTAISWDDVMSNMVRASLEAPQSTSSLAGSKGCYWAKYSLITVNANCLPISVKTIISTNNRRIITAYPDSSTC